MPFESYRNARRVRQESPVNGTVEHGGRTRAATPEAYPFIEHHTRSTRDAGGAMSLNYLRRRALPGWLALLLAVPAVSQSGSVDQAISPNDLARAVVANELKSQDANHSRWMYHVDREEQGKKKAKEVVQTGQGSLDRLVEIDGHPLNDDEQQQEKKRIEALAWIIHKVSSQKSKDALKG